MRERLQRTLQRNLAPGYTERRPLHNDQTSSDRHRSMAAPVQLRPAAARSRYAATGPQSNLREISNHWYRKSRLDNRIVSIHKIAASSYI